MRRIRPVLKHCKVPKYYDQDYTYRKNAHNSEKNTDSTPAKKTPPATPNTKSHDKGKDMTSQSYQGMIRIKIPIISEY